MSEEAFKARQYQEGKRDIQDWFSAERRYIESMQLPPSKLKEDILWKIGVCRQNYPHDKPMYAPYYDALLEELNKAL